MLGFALVACLAALPAPPAASAQDTGTVDAPVYENATYGVSIPRPFDDWVFEPGRSRRTATIIFHPRGASLGSQLWGAVILTPYPGRATLAQLTDRRVEMAWRTQLGSSLAILGRDSLALAGFPARHFALSGVVNGVALRAEEYLIARRRDLIVLQFRCPQAMPCDSVAVGFRRVLSGLRIGAAPAVARRAQPAVPDTVAGPDALSWSPWQVRSYDALVRYDSERVRADFAVRVEIVNDGPVAVDSAAILLWPGFTVDSLRTGASAARPAGSSGVARVRLPQAVEPQGSAWVTCFYHLGAEANALPPELGGFAPDAAYLAFDWLPLVRPAVDPSGQVARTMRPRFTLSLDVPATWRAVAPGRMTAEIVSAGRRRTTWATDDVTAATPAIALGQYRILARRAGGLGVNLWLAPDDSVPAATLDSLVASVRAAWVFCSRAFGRLPIADLNVVSTRLPGTRGFLGLILGGGLDTSRDDIYREMARSWWGNAADGAGVGAWWVREGFPAWTVVAARGALEGDTVRQRLVRQAEASWRAALAQDPDVPLAALFPGAARADLLQTKGLAAIEAARRAAGEAAFREAILSLSLEHRNGWLSLQAVLAAFGPDAQAVLRTYLF